MLILTPTQAELFTVKEATLRLKISRSLFYEAIAAGRIRIVRFGSAVRIPAPEIERLAREGLPARVDG
jgi:excisionase family DNA binding protein